MGIHGDKNQSERDYVLRQFRKSSAGILVATDVAARGLGTYTSPVNGRARLLGRWKTGLMPNKLRKLSYNVRRFTKYVLPTRRRFTKYVLPTRKRFTKYMLPTRKRFTKYVSPTRRGFTKYVLPTRRRFTKYVLPTRRRFTK
ncbi:putative ATP-dependent RNA helicase ddx17 [Homalodisca vitripennis]|nr:putative ATP-dependent RNA helicase ddx17 [Homalodisca vitripennis]